MGNKRIKLFIVLVLIIILISSLSSFVYADICGNARSESAPCSPPTRDSSTPSTPTPTPTISGPKTYTVTHYTTIEGCVYEDIGESIGTSGVDSSQIGLPIAGVTVNLLRGDSVVSSTVTGSDGTYSFSPSPGTYTTEFIYGNIDKTNLNNTSSIKNVLKYNGHDYITVSAPSGGERINVRKIEVEQSGKGCSQVFLAVDCSYSSRSTKIVLNGTTKTRLQIATEAAKILIDKLINSGENIYIGLVFFSGTSYRAVSLTKDKELLYTALDDIVLNNWYTPNTNIVAALDKVKSSYYNNDKNNSNRYVAILSDGIPTSDGTHETYSNMSNSELLDTLKTVKQTTKNKLNELKNDGIKIFSLIVKGDEDENQWSQDIFGRPASDIFISSQDGQEMVNSITEDLQEYIVSTTEEKEYSSGYSVLAGYEDSNRRKTVDSNFETFNYSNTIMFQQINNYNSSEKDKQQAKELSDKTWMRVVGGSYSIDSVPSPALEIHYKRVYDEDTDSYHEEVDYYVQHVAATYSGQNIVLAQRPALSLVTTTTATALKIILSDGKILSSETRDIGSDLPLIQYMDDEIAHGTTIQIEYTIRIKNDSSIQCNYLELINHLPKGFIFSQNSALVTEAKTNKNYGWEVASLESLFNNGYISEYTKNTYGDRNTLKVTLDNKGKGKDGFYISPGGEYNLKLTVSKVISKLSNLELPIEDFSEVLVYKDSSNRRMAYLQPCSLLTSNKGELRFSQLIGVYPGDSTDGDFSSITNSVFILPPTGLAQSSKQIIIINVTLIFVLGLIALAKIKRKNSRK